MCFARRWRRRVIRGYPRRSANGGIGAASERRPMQGRKQRAALTTPDLVLLSLLAERPMHGYQANLLLEQRQVRDWAGISRPQVYYSLEKLLRTGLLREVEGREAAAGPERRVVATTAKGRAALGGALGGGGGTAR